MSTNKKQCTKLEKGKYLYDGNCIDEIKDCLYYSSKTACSKCSSDYILSNGKCEGCGGSYVIIENDIWIKKIDRWKVYESDGTYTSYFSEELYGPFTSKITRNSNDDKNDSKSKQKDRKNEGKDNDNYGNKIYFNFIIFLFSFILFCLILINIS